MTPLPLPIMPLEHGITMLEPGEPQAMLIIGTLAILLSGAVHYRNPMAAMSLGVNVIVLVLVGLLDVGPELFWLSVVGTSMLLIAGLVVRWTA